MSEATHRDNYEELRLRIIREAGLGRPEPYVSVAIASLLVDMLVELGACVMELELLHEIREPAPPGGR